MMPRPRPFFAAILLWSLAGPVTGGASAAMAVVVAGDFQRSGLEGWEPRRFSGETRYSLVEVNGRRVIEAVSEGGASGLVRGLEVDLQQTPWINWSWKVEHAFEHANEQTRRGDDFPARVYVVVSGGLAFWRTRALNYVWAGTTPRGESWPSPFAGSNAIMIAQRSGDQDAGTWHRERRNVREDLRRHFGQDFRSIDAIAIMTDTDNTGGRARTYYGDIYFSAR